MCDYIKLKIYEKKFENILKRNNNAYTNFIKYILKNYLVEAHRCKRLDDPKRRKLCRRSRLLGVGNDALRRFEVRGYKILS